MKVQNVSFGDNGIKNIGEKNNSKVTSEKRGLITDSVRISGAANGLEHAEQVLYAVDMDYPPRTELVKAVSERIARGAYNNELLDSVAEKAVDSHAVKDIITEVAVYNSKKSNDRAKKIELTHDQVKQGYFDSSEIMEKVALRLIIELGLDSYIT